MREIVGNFKFQLVRKVAEGGMGAVYEAYLLGVAGFQKRVAIKTIIPSYAQDNEFVDMFIGEARLVADLIHQNIVQIYQLGEYEGGFYIAMEYINGINLQEFIERHKALNLRIDMEFAAFIISRVCRGLAHAHNKRGSDGHLLGVVHRDVSPKNIMLTDEGVVKLTDFGIAKARNLMENREGDVLLGKTQYMSPEQASFQQTDARSDIFSLGTVFYELLTLDPLFTEDETLITLNKVVKQEIRSVREFVKDIPEKLEKIVLCSLQRSLTQRYQSADVMGDDLEHYMYDKGFGPTNQSFQKYLLKLFPYLKRY
jgi:serine/threonine protein kinase